MFLSFAEEGPGSAVEDKQEETPKEESETPEEGGEPQEEIADIPLGKKVKLPNGEVIDAQELAYGYMRQKDYTQKLQELSEERRQLQLAKDAAKEKPPEQAKQQISGQIDDVKQALSELSEDDPQAKALSVMLDKLERLEQKVTDAERKNEQSTAEEAYKQQVEYMRKLTDDTLSEEQKKYTLPKFKNPKTGKDIDFSDKWKEVVLTTLSTIDQDMTVPEFKKLAGDIGRKAYERLQDEISAISASYASAKKKPTIQQPETGGGKEKTPLTLSQKIEAALEKVEREKGG